MPQIKDTVRAGRFKKCSKCGLEKPYPAFSKQCDANDGLRSHCKECMKVWRDLNLTRESIRKRGWRENHKIQDMATARRAIRKYRFLNKQMRIAQKKAQRRYMFRQVCEVPSCDKSGFRHHDDYGEPLRIRWLCRQHHADLHRANRAVKGNETRFN